MRLLGFYVLQNRPGVQFRWNGTFVAGNPPRQVRAGDDPSSRVYPNENTVLVNQMPPPLSRNALETTRPPTKPETRRGNGSAGVESRSTHERAAVQQVEEVHHDGSTVNDRLFGSGNKVTHNVVGTFGVWQGAARCCSPAREAGAASRWRFWVDGFEFRFSRIGATLSHLLSPLK